jgi:hypothetical protein
MLIYHPMFDPYHGALRLVATLMDSGQGQMEWERLRLLDYLVVFPHRLLTLKLPQQLRSAKSLFKSIPQPYENFPSAPQLFFQLGEIQESAGRLLVGRDLLDRNAILNGTAQLIESDALSRVQELVQRLSHRSADWYKFVVEQLRDLPLQGKNGLKERSGVMEFRHDPV